MNLSDEIRKQIEKNKGLKLAVGEINNHLSVLEGLVRKDIAKQLDEAYQKGFEDGKAVNDKGCEGCKYAEMGSDTTICAECCNAYHNQWTAKDNKIEVGDEVYCKDDDESDSGVVTWAGNVRVCAMWQDGSAGEVQKDELIKTGRHFDIASILEGMRND